MTSLNFSPISRRFVTGIASSTALGLLATSPLLCAATALANQGQPRERTLSGRDFNLTVGYSTVNYTGKARQATTINQSLPGPVLRWKEGETVAVRVHNTLAVDSSLHWHGLILPSNMDGVPGLSFGGIKPGESYRYQFKLNQSGTYWYHSHSAYQEQTGLYGAIVIEPIQAAPYYYDRDFVVLLTDWSDTAPDDLYANLKKMPHIYNINERTLADWRRDVASRGYEATVQARQMWNQMRMSDRDISDVTGATYTFLMNGKTPAEGWLGSFNRGEKILLRVINGSAMTFFDVRIPGLKMTVVAADGQYVQPVTVDEFRIGTAETYDVIVEPSAEQAYMLFCQSIDRSGYARGTLTPDLSLAAPIPEMDESPILTMADMGMQHEATDCSPDHAAMGHCKAGDMLTDSHQLSLMGSGLAGYGTAQPISYQAVKMGPHVDMLARAAQYRLDDPGVGLRHSGRKILTYSDLFNLNKTRDLRQPSREIELHLTGNMSRYMWSIDGIKGGDADPIKLAFGERVRITLVNDTMMNHPIHLHGVWSELETGEGLYIPRKHTVVVQPGAKISYLVTADARGRWAYHCHLLYHMMGMFREVTIA